MERWKPKVECSARERRLLKLAGKSRKLFVFLREHRHEVLDGAFQRPESPCAHAEALGPRSRGTGRHDGLR